MNLRFTNLTTPIGPLVQNIEQYPFSLAPERTEDLKRLIENRITGEILADEAGFEFSAFVMCRRIYLSLGAMERIWAYCLGTAYVYVQWQLSNYTKEIIFADTELGERIQAMLLSARASEISQIKMVWPSNAVSVSEIDTEVIVPLACEMFGGVLAFIQLHEIGHIQLTHIANMETPSDVLIRHEFEADEWAFHWVLEKWRDYPGHGGAGDFKNFVKRSVLLANALAILSCVQFYFHSEGGRVTHPNPIDRLLVFLMKWANDSSGLPHVMSWAVATVTISIHVANDPTVDPASKWETFRGYLESVRDNLSGHGLAEELLTKP